VSIDGSSTPDEPQGFKVGLHITTSEAGLIDSLQFHLRAYCVASGALKVYLFEKILALFSAVPYVQPSVEEDEEGDLLPLDLGPHLTNTSLQTDRGEEGVRLFNELVSCHILSGPHGARTQFSTDDMKSIIDQMVVILAETFKVHSLVSNGSSLTRQFQAALENPVHFQVQYSIFKYRCQF
jgi:hypothetical protein